MSQAILDGALSVCDPEYHKGNLPLYVTVYWNQMHSVLNKWHGWMARKAWLQDLARTHGLGSAECTVINRALSHLDALPWNQPTDILGTFHDTTTYDLGVLLSDGMVTTTTVNMMISWILTEMSKLSTLSQQTSDYEVMAMPFWDAIRNTDRLAYFQNSRNLRWFVVRLEEKLRRTPKRLLFPVYITSMKHFIVIQTDHENQTVAYGECAAYLHWLHH